MKNDEWSFLAVYTREEIEGMIRRGEISETQGGELLRLKRRSIDGKEYYLGIDVSIGSDESVSRHVLTARDGSQAMCGGPGLCEWCDKKGRR